MPSRSRFHRLDAFTKTVEDARVRTSSGGIITIVSLLLILYLTWQEWTSYRRIVVHPEILVDKTRGEKMEVHLNISFPHLPCSLATLDVMDDTGSAQSGVLHGIVKTRLSPAPESRALPDGASALDLHGKGESAPHMDPSYCGDCGGASPPLDVAKPGCCNTCAELRQAYALKRWSFEPAKNLEQCAREHYSEEVAAQRKEGCRIAGTLRINKVAGQFHIAPGRSFNFGAMHVHDTQEFDQDQHPHDFSHTIHHLGFGPRMDDSGRARWAVRRIAYRDPLDGTQQTTAEKRYSFTYYVKVVGTSYLPLGHHKRLKGVPAHSDAASHAAQTAADTHHQAPLGSLGVLSDGSLLTHQYSVTSHSRPIAGGRAPSADPSRTHVNAAGKEEVEHAAGGIPGVTFNYDISPMRIVNREARDKGFGGFLAGVCAVIGGTLTVAAALDRAMYEGGRRVKGYKER